MKLSLSAWLDSFLPADLAQRPDTIRRHKIFVATSLIVALFAGTYGVMSYFINFTVGLYAMIASVVMFAALPFVLRSGRSIWLLGVIFASFILALNIILVTFSGGLFTSPVTPFIILPAIFALIFCNVRTAIVFVVVSVAYVIVMVLMHDSIASIPVTYIPSFHTIFLTLALSGLVIIMFLVTNTYEQTKNEALRLLEEKQEELRREQELSDSLLLNILPEATVQELKSVGVARPRAYEMVSVLFADFVSFTRISQTMTATELVTHIDRYFTRFDSIMDRHGIEKIKTMGDSYMCVAGLPVESEEHALRIIAAAREMLAVIEEMHQQEVQQSGTGFDVRIGVHSGPVVAGIVGKKKFAYDIWGDTVNVAARLQQLGQVNRISMSSVTHELVRGEVPCTHSGTVMAKNRGEIDVFVVSDATPADGASSEAENT
jgi:class 3 adenylate cyclase